MPCGEAAARDAGQVGLRFCWRKAKRKPNMVPMRCCCPQMLLLLLLLPTSPLAARLQRVA